MSSINIIQKYQYFDSAKEPVELKEYMILEDETLASRYAVFKLQNKLTQGLNEVRIEVSEYNENNQLIERVIFDYHATNIPPKADFVPNAKLNLNPLCVSLSYRLVFALFEQVEYSEGEFKKIPFTKEQFEQEFETKKEIVPLTKKEKKQAKKKIKALKKEAKLQKKLEKQLKKQEARIKAGKKVGKFKVSLVSKNQKVVAPKVIGTIFTILLVSFLIFTSMWLYPEQVNSFSFGEYELQRKNSNTAYVVGYYGFKTKITIPETMGEYTITAIGSEAFKNSSITEITFESDINIGDSAFSGSKLSTIVGGEHVLNVDSNAFKNTSISELELENASLKPNALASMNNLKSLKFKKSQGMSHFYELFGKDKSYIPARLQSVEVGSNITGEYLKDCASIENFTTYGDAIVEFGAYACAGFENYYLSSKFEAMNGKIISFANNVSYLSELSFEDTDYSVQEVVIDTADNFNQIMNYYPNVNTYYMTDSSLLTTSVSSSLVAPARIVVSTDILTSSFMQKAFMSNAKGYIQSVEIIGANNSVAIDKFSLSMFINSNELVAQPNVSFAAGAFSDFKTLYDLSIGTPGQSLRSLGIPNSVSTVVLKASKIDKIVESFASGYINLTSLELPDNIKSVDSFIVDGCYNLDSLVIPSSVESMGKCVIGKECISLKYVSLPFLGTTKDDTEYYKNVNLSSSYTEYLIITDAKKVALDTEDKLTLKALEVNCEELYVSKLDNIISSVFISNAKIVRIEANFAYNYYLSNVESFELSNVNYETNFYLHKTEFTKDLNENLEKFSCRINNYDSYTEEEFKELFNKQF